MDSWDMIYLISSDKAVTFPLKFQETAADHHPLEPSITIEHSLLQAQAVIQNEPQSLWILALVVAATRQHRLYFDK